MTINKNNYEAFFLDYHEKNLSPGLVAELLLFLEQHPELQKEFDAFAAITISNDDAVVFEGKEKLKKVIITRDNFKDFAVANLEGDLTSEEKKQYNNFLTNNPAYKKENELFAKTKLRADLSLKFPDKEALKKGKGRIISLNRFYLAAAACVLLLLGLFFSKQQTNTYAPQSAQNNVQPDPVNKTGINSIPNQSKVEEYEKILNNKESNTPINPVIPIASNRSNKKIIKKQKPLQLSNPSSNQTIALIETKSALIIEEAHMLRLKSLQTFPVYILDEYYAAVEPLQATPAVVFDNIKKDAIKKLEKGNSSNDENWFPDDAYNTKKKTRFIDVLASALNKISGKKVTIQPEYNTKGEMVSYDFTAGPISFKKDLSK